MLLTDTESDYLTQGPTVRRSDPTNEPDHASTVRGRVDGTLTPLAEIPSCARRDSPPWAELILGVVASSGESSVAGLVFAEAVAVAGDVEHDGAV